MDMRYGIAQFTVKDSEVFRCESLAFKPAFADDNIFVQLSPARAKGGKSMLESAAVWLEYVTRSGFTACVDTSGPISSLRVSYWYANINICRY